MIHVFSVSVAQFAVNDSISTSDVHYVAYNMYLETQHAPTVLPKL